MPSSLGHAFAGIAAVWAIDLIPGAPEDRTGPPAASFFQRAGGGLTLLCAGLATVPDADLFFGVHRTWSHSLFAAALVTIVAAAVTGQVTRLPRGQVARIALMCGAAYASHLLLDWLAIDRHPPAGLQLGWPFSERWFISGLDFFPQIERQEMWSARAMRINLNAFAWETAALLPVLWGLWSIRVKTVARFATQLAGSDHPS
jgi:membrane-bound metal-dependent hydrolase YbcI (DUF457 family)